MPSFKIADTVYISSSSHTFDHLNGYGLLHVCRYWQDTSGSKSHDFYGVLLSYHRIGRGCDLYEIFKNQQDQKPGLWQRLYQSRHCCFPFLALRPLISTALLPKNDLGNAINILYDGDQYLALNPRVRGQSRNAIRAKFGIAYVLNGDLDPATTILEDEDLVQREPDNPEALYAHWLLQVRRDGIEKASEAFDVFKEARPKRWERGSYHLYYGLFYKALGKEKDAHEHFQLAYKYESNNVYIMIQYAESLYSTAMKAKSGIDIILSKSMAKKCARIVQRIYDFDSNNSIAENLEVDLYYEFDIQLSKIKK
jgi:tetratricopeptide (TPR) repeat protein